MTKESLQLLTERIINGYQITKEEALSLEKVPLLWLCQEADHIRKHFCDNYFDLCTIINGKSGRCQEDCKFCAQSAFYKTAAEHYPLLSQDEIVDSAKYNEKKGVLRYSIVTSGRKLKKEEIQVMCKAIKGIKKESDIDVCVSFGLLNQEEFQQVKEAGVTRIHNNLETSRKHFPKVCSTHTYEDKIASIKGAQAAGLNVCSGGIMGLGEAMEDRVDMAFELKNLGVRSVPINMLNPIKGTPFEKQEKLTVDEMRRIVAIYRFIIPDASIRLAGGRGLLEDKGKSCFTSGANAAITGDMLTTAGISIEQDLSMLKELGFEVRLWNR